MALKLGSLDEEVLVKFLVTGVWKIGILSFWEHSRPLREFWWLAVVVDWIYIYSRCRILWVRRPEVDHNLGIFAVVVGIDVDDRPVWVCLEEEV
jgi:hypothetical protein